jgi:hypothetical protein
MSPELPPRRALCHVQTMLLAVLCASLAVLVLAKGLMVATLFNKPGEQTSPAAASAYVARRVQQGGPVYADWRARPHVIAWYGPALYWPVGQVGRWLGSDVQGLYLIGRSVSLAATLGTIALIIWMAWGVPQSPPLIPVLMGAVFMAADEVLARFDISFRADAPACFLTMAGLALVVRAAPTRSLVPSIPVFLLAFLYKQSFVAGPIAVVAWLWLHHRRREAIRYGLCSLAALAVTVILLQVATHGLYFLNTVDGLKGNTTWWAIPFMFQEIVRPCILPLVVALCVFASECITRSWSPAGVLFALSLLLSAASTWRDGSSVNYYTLPLALACILCGRQLAAWWPERSTSMSASVPLTLVLALGLLRYAPDAAVRLTESGDRWRAFSTRHDQHAEMAGFLRRLATYLDALPGPVLSQFNDMTLTCRNSIMIDPFTFTSMADVGAFDDRPLIEQITRGQIEAIVFDPKAPATYQSTDFFSRRWKQAMSGRYELAVRDRYAEIYRPVRPAAGATVNAPP